MLKPVVQPLINWSPLAWNSNNLIIERYGADTADFLGSGITFNNVEGRNKTHFVKGENKALLWVFHGRLETQPDWRHSYLAPSLGRFPTPVEGGVLYVLDGAAIRLVKNNPPWDISALDRTGPEGDVHFKLIERAFAPVTALKYGGSLLFYESVIDPVATLGHEVSSCDFHPLPGGTYMDLLGVMFDPWRINRRHAQTALITDPRTGIDRLQTIEETRAGIRDSLDRLFEEIYKLAVKRGFGQPTWDFNLSPRGSQVVAKIKEMERAYKERRYADVVRIIEELRPEFLYPRMRNIDLPDDFNDPKLLGKLVDTYLTFASYIEKVSRLLREKKGDSAKDLSPIFEVARNIVRYLPEENWTSFAEGSVWWTTLGQKKTADAIHLFQDVFSHCREWKGDVCQKFVTANLFGVGNLHTATDDEMFDAEGREKPKVRTAVLVSRVTQILLQQIPHREYFLRVKQNILNYYFPPPQ